MLNKSWLRPQWQEIDYSQSDKCEMPFDGGNVLVRLENSEFHVAYFDEKHDLFYVAFENIGISLDYSKPTHWMPIPEFLKG